jgi:hypothetical protein
MSDTVKIIIAGLAGVIIATGAFLVFKPTTSSKFGDVTNYNQMSLPTAGGVLCGTTPTLLMATSSAGRPFVSISNLSSTAAIYVGYGTAALYTGIMIPASTTVTMNQLSINYSALYCIAGTNASTSLSYVN